MSEDEREIETPGPDEDAVVAAPPADRRGRRWLGRRATAVIGVLTALLGFAIAVQVRAHSGPDRLSGLREDDLIGILDNQNAHADRLRQQIAQLRDTLQRLQNSGDRSAAARQQAEQQANALAVLLGTVPATGPGVTVTVQDPKHALRAEDLLDVVEELRGAGAEAIQFGPVRVSTNTAFTGHASTVEVDGAPLQPPYTVLAIGDPTKLDTALNIPGGVAAAVRSAGGQLAVREQNTVHILATRALPTPKYAKPGGR